LPLKDDEGVIGILVFEAERTDFASPHERALAEILANQATVAVRNARLYHQVPLADTLGALAARRDAFFALPRRRRIAIAAAALFVVGAATLIRWPLRIVGADPVFRPLARADVRPTLSGVIDRVFVDEGARLERGAPVAHLHDDELRASRDAAAAAVTEAEREAAIAAAQGNASDERLQRARADVLTRDLRLVEQELGATTVRSPVSGVVLTPRPDERVGQRVEAGEAVITVGRTDSLELDFGVDERDVARVRDGDEVRFRIAALPQRTFAGRVVWIAPVPGDSGSSVSFPVRAAVANPDGLLRPGMAAYARVLTEPASAAWRVLRDPMRALRLLSWRIWR
jgi:RND family efflux transporter MFP subunit